jgi:putative membrane protein
MADAERRPEATHATIARSAQATKSSAERSTELAVDRTVLAAERTYAAWVRTALAALAAGVGARALLDGVVAEWLAQLAGCTLVLFSAFCFVAAVWRELRPRFGDPQPDVRRLPAALLIAVNGVLVLVSLAAFIGLLVS